MRKIISLIAAAGISIISAITVYAVEAPDLIFTPDTNGKYIYCNNHEYIDRKDLADTSNEKAKFLMNNENMTPDNYALFAGHVNHTELRNEDGVIIEPGFDIELDVLFRAKEDTEINLTALGFEVPQNRQYWYQGKSYTYEEEHGCFNSWADYMKLPIRQIDSGKIYTPSDFEPVKITIPAGEEVWLSKYIPNYCEVPFYRVVTIMADFTIETGMCDVNIAALKSTGTLKDRSTFFENAAFGSYIRDRQYKGIADSLNKVTAELSYTIDDWTWGGSYLPVKVHNQYTPDGNEIYKWYTHLNPRADEWSYDICTESDMLSFKYYDKLKASYYGSQIKEKDNYWYFDTMHNDYSAYEGTNKSQSAWHIPNRLLTEEDGNTEGCNLGNYGVELNYKINITNTGNKIKYVNYCPSTASNIVVVLCDKDGKLITPYAVCKGVNTARVMDTMACVELPPQQTTEFILKVILTTNYAGGIENSLKITDTPTAVDVYQSNRQEITKEYKYTGREFYKWEAGKLYFSTNNDVWRYIELDENVKNIFKGSWNEYEIKYTGKGYMVKAALYDGRPYYDVRDFYRKVYFLDENMKLCGYTEFDNYPTAFTAAKGIYYVNAGTPQLSDDTKTWAMAEDIQMPCWNYGRFAAKFKDGTIYLSTDGKEFLPVEYQGFKPVYIDSLGDLYYYSDANVLYLSKDGIYWQQLYSNDDISSVYKTEKEVIINGSEKIVIPEFDNNIALRLENEYLSCENAPVVVDGTTLVPIRVIAEKLGATVEWGIWQATVAKDNKEIVLTMDLDIAKVNGSNKKLETNVILHNGTMMVPARFVAEQFGYTVSYDSENNIAIFSR